MGIFDGIVGSLVSGIGGVVQNASNQEFADEQATKNRDYQTQMSNTAYQRGMADMKAAGLNPILAYQKGPASSPTGSMAATSVSNVGEAMVNSYNNSARAASDNARTDAETGKIPDQQALLKQELQNATATHSQILANTAKTMSENTQVQANTRLTDEMIKSAPVTRALTNENTTKQQSENSARSADKSYYDSWFGKGARWIGNTLGEINPLKGFIQLGK